MKNTFYINGEYLPEHNSFIKVADLGLLRGFGIFDFFRSVNGKIIFLNDHLNRFEQSAAKMGLKIPHTRTEMIEIIENIKLRNDAPLIGIKMILTGGYSADGYVPTESNFIVTAKPFAFFDKPEGMHLMSLEHLRELADIKTLNYAVPILNRPKMLDIGADDFLYHKFGFVSELSRSNLFLVKDNILITPKNDILHGVTRLHVLKMASKIMQVEERDVTLLETISADELFTTGSTKRITPITKLDQKNIKNGKIGEVTKLLLEKFLAYEQI